MGRILVIGGASLDVLFFGGQRAEAAGGAGLYTAAAASRAGAQATMFAPRPEPVPPALQPALARIDWQGPVVPPEQLPHFEIVHHGGGKAELRGATWGAEAQLSPADLATGPFDLPAYDFVHIAGLRSAGRQLDFLQAARQAGARRIAAGTYGHVVYHQTDLVRALFEGADLFFMNENEANGLFGSAQAACTAPGKLLFVTLGARGALVVQGGQQTHVPGAPAGELDPTGAGDTFCGATLAGLARGEHPAMAARQAVALAGQMIGAVGPAALWRTDPLPALPADPRVEVDGDQVAWVADLVATLPDVQPFDFTGAEFPPVGHPAALDYFFSATLQQFGFWEDRDGRYRRPMIAPIDGEARKGSDYLWRAWLRPLAGDPAFYGPPRQATLSRADLLALLRADDGSDPLPALDLHLAQANGYGRDMLALGWTPGLLLAEANAAPRPLQALLASLDAVAGYGEDPLRKKSGLLALILAQRPERFLEPAPAEAFPPVIDYHLMRSCLRIGLVRLTDAGLSAAVAARRLVPPADEWAIRLACYEAIGRVAAAAGRSMGAVDWFFFNARRRCPEMTEPDCPSCPVDPICTHRKELFQPVLRTAYY